MPFFQVQNHYVFLYRANYEKLNAIAFKDKDSNWLFNSKIKGKKESQEAQKLRHIAINELYKNSSYEDFYYQWIQFNLELHEDILEDLPYLLYDYGCVNKCFSYRRIDKDRSAMSTLFSDLYYNEECFYEIALFSKALFRKPKQIFSIIIDTMDIQSIYGELNDFTLATKNGTLNFGPTIRVIDK